jgi:hypothetical protein
MNQAQKAVKLDTLFDSNANSSMQDILVTER